ncbi:hypothetical protein LTR10_005618 [Elasticomyces elasticus]|nr:hypothetical protein LTR10_005618 [Elasticomyces elasticus]KAK4976356.1 hypothetical protein LTR42_003985 [Elasticomyces elasticus]
MAKMQGAKKRKRPTRILATRKWVSEKLREIYNRNANDSPLLSLPPEIRTRIWRSLLSGHTVHVDASDIDKVQHYVCKNMISDHELAQTEKADKATMHFRAYQNHHMRCRPANQYVVEDKAVSRLHLNALRTCRQIHQEAAILPYAENVLAFASNNSLDYFLDTVVLEQARALQRIVIARSDQGSYDPPLDVKFLKSKLQNLEELIAFVVFSGGATARHFSSEQYVRDLEARNLLAFDGVLIKQVTVAAYNIYKNENLPDMSFGWRNPRYDVPREMLEEWVKSIEEGSATTDAIGT